MEMLATARHFTAEEALQAGFVNRVVPAADLESDGARHGRDDFDRPRR